MNMTEYAKSAMRTDPHDDDILNNDILTRIRQIDIGEEYLPKDQSLGLLHGILGMSGEIGEAVELVKKEIFYGKGIDRTKLIKELGDILWYLNRTAISIGSSLDEVATVNIEKLRARYPEKYSDQLARTHDSE